MIDGRVSVNGKIITELGIKVNPRKDNIVVDGKKLILPDAKQVFWIILNKPKSLLTTMQDDLNRDTILSLIPKANELRLVPVGGLDRDYTGLLLLTNEVGWIHPLTHPSYVHINRYEIVINGIPTDTKLELLRKGILLEGDKTPCTPCEINVIDIDNRANLCLLDIKLEESKPLQLQRMMDIINCPLVSLKRTEFCNIKMKSLKKGLWRELTKTEIDTLKSCKKREGIAYDSQSNMKAKHLPQQQIYDNNKIIKDNNSKILKPKKLYNGK